jgi:hypothetical protein
MRVPDHFYASIDLPHWKISPYTLKKLGGCGGGGIIVIFKTIIMI